MAKKLVLVDCENVYRIDLSRLDESSRAIVFFGAMQAPPKAARRPATAHRFKRVDASSHGRWFDPNTAYQQRAAP